MADESLGGFLRKEREARGISLEQVASATKIGVRQLHSLENDQFDDLPAKPFIRGFVNSYCRFVGLDSKEVLVRFAGFIDEKSSERPDRSSGHSGYAFERREGDQSRTFLWIVLGLFTLGGGALFVVFKPTFKHRKHPQIEKLQAAQASPGPSAVGAASGHALSFPSPLPSQSPSPTPDTPPAPQQASTPLAPVSTPLPSPSPLAVSVKPDPLNSGAGLGAAETKYKVVFRVHEDVWIRYKVDDRQPMRIVVRRDRVLVLRAKASIRVQVSDPDAVSYIRGGGPPKKVAESTDLVMIDENATLFFPSDLKSTIRDPFPGAGKLPKDVPESPKRP